MDIRSLRNAYHQHICRDILRITIHGEIEYPNIADGSNRSSVQIARGIFARLNCEKVNEPIKGQTAGGRFETVTKDFLEKAFTLLAHVRPGRWHYAAVQTAISNFDQYAHLAYVETAVQQDQELASALGSDYIITPDIVVARWPLTDAEINREGNILPINDDLAQLTPLREANVQPARLILHASISCKWTIRSDRSQNTRTEALNLIRNRKGHLPHVVAVTAEPLPTRLAALALGTGDLDCVYHFALPELRAAIVEADNPDQLEMLDLLVNGRRLRDISDLPFDLAV